MSKLHLSCFNQVCTIVHAFLTTKLAVRLVPCHHLFHRHCIERHIVQPRTFPEIRNPDLERGFFHDGDQDEDACDVLSAEEDTSSYDEYDDEELIETELGWTNLDGAMVWWRENDFDYDKVWTKAQMLLAHKFFHDNEIEGSAERRARSKDSTAFAEDLRAVKVYTTQQVTGSKRQRATKHEPAKKRRRPVADLENETALDGGEMEIGMVPNPNDI